MAVATHVTKFEEGQTEHGIQKRAADPGSPTTGQAWINTTTDEFKYYNGSSTIVFGLSPGTHYVHLTGANGFGSTDTRIARFTTVVSNVGSDLGYADSATLGTTFTIARAGFYAFSWSSHPNAGQGVGFSLNTTQGSTDMSGITAADILVEGTEADTNTRPSGCSWTGYLAISSVVRPHANGNVFAGNTALWAARIG